MMKNKNVLAILLMLMVILAAKIDNGWAQQSLQFPKGITYEIIKNQQSIGNCQLIYLAKTGSKGYRRWVSTLRMSGFAHMSISPRDTRSTTVFSEDFQLFSDTVKRGKDTVSKNKLIEIWDFDGTQKRYFEYEEANTYKRYQVRVPSMNMDINFLSSFLVLSQRAAQGNTNRREIFNFVEGRTVIKMKLTYAGSDQVYFNGQNVTASLLELKDKKRKKFQFSIYKDNDGDIYPIRIILFPEKLEFRAKGVRKSILRADLMVSIFPFMDLASQQVVDSPEKLRLLSEAVQIGIRETKVGNKPLGFTEADNTPGADAENIKHLVDILTNPHMPKEEKNNRIINRIMEPNGMELVVTGYYRELANGSITVSPIVIFQYNQNFVSRNLDFKSKYELFCRVPGTGELVLCKPAARRIANAVKELLAGY